MNPAKAKRPVWALTAAVVVFLSSAPCAAGMIEVPEFHEFGQRVVCEPMGPSRVEPYDVYYGSIWVEEGNWRWETVDSWSQWVDCYWDEEVWDWVEYCEWQFVGTVPQCETHCDEYGCWEECTDVDVYDWVCWSEWELVDVITHRETMEEWGVLKRVPEPAAIALLAGGGLVLIRRRT